MISTREIFQKNLKRLIFEKDTSCTKISKKLNVASSTVRGWKIGKNCPNFDSLDKLAEILQTTTVALLSNPDKPCDMSANPLNNVCERYKNLKPENQKKVIEYIQLLLDSETLHNGKNA